MLEKRNAISAKRGAISLIDILQYDDLQEREKIVAEYENFKEKLDRKIEQQSKRTLLLLNETRFIP